MPLKRLRDGTYEARYYRDGVKDSPYMRENFGTITGDEARALYAKRKAEAAARRSKGGHLLTVEQASISYLKSKGGEREQGIVADYVLPKWGKSRVESLGGAEIENWLAELVAGGLTKASANRIWATFRALLNWAHKKMGTEVPALGRVDSFKLPHGGARMVFLEVGEWHQLATAFDDEERFRAYLKDKRRMNGLKPEGEAAGEYLARLRSTVPVFEALLYTGARLSDVLGLTWSDVDLEAGIVTINQDKSEGAAPIRLPIAEPLKLTLGRMKRGKGKERVFRLPDGAAIEKITLQRAMVVAKNLTGLRTVITPHTLRHTLGSWLAMDGVSLRTIQEILGHSSPVITARHYAHLTPSSLKGAISKVAAKVAGGAKRHQKATKDAEQ